MKIHCQLDRLTQVVAWLAGCAVMLGALQSAPAYAETKTVVAQGSTDVCFSTREIALNLARTGASNDAHDECRALGDGWSFTGNKFPGYEQCKSCGSNGFKCKVTQAVYICTNMQKERAEKAAKERAEKEARDKEAKDKADRVKAERELQRKLAKEKSDREHAEKVAKAKVAKDKLDREKAERAAQKKLAMEKADKERAQKAAEAKAAKEKRDLEKKELAAKKEVIKEIPKKEEPKKNPADKNASIDKNKSTHKNDPSPGLGASALDGTSNTGSAQTKDVRSLLDENAERPAIRKRLSQEISKYRRAAEPGCQSKMRDIDSCYTKTGCSRPAESPSAERCKEIPPYPYGGAVNALVLTRQPSPGEICYREDAECRAARLEWAEEKRETARREGEALRSRQSDWTSRYGDVSKECKVRSKEREAFSSCQKQFDATCNPNRFSNSEDCVNDQVRTKGPTESDARKLMQKDWDQRAKSGSSITNSILD